MNARCGCILLALSAVAVGYARDFSYPAIPDSIDGIEHRAAYLARHYWDCADLTSPELLATPDRVLDYICLLRQIPTGAVRDALYDSMNRMRVNEDNLSRWQWWMEHFLHDMQSPICDNELYLTVLEMTLTVPLDSAFLIRPLAQLELARRNRIGYQAENFSFSTSTVGHCELYGIGNEWCLLMFHRPSCEVCRGTISEMHHSTVLKSLIQNDMMAVVAISDEEEQASADGWIYGCDHGAVERERLYEIQQFPCFYLLDSNHRVVLRQVGWNTVEEFLNNLIAARSATR